MTLYSIAAEFAGDNKPKRVVHNLSRAELLAAIADLQEAAEQCCWIQVVKSETVFNMFPQDFNETVLGEESKL